MTKDLTEQWKNGELEEGDYFYVKTKMGNIFTDSIDYDRPHWDGFKNDAEEVLASVPSYERWNAVLESNENLFKTTQVLKKRLVEVTEENQKLKDLLKECVEVLNNAQRNYGYDDSIIDICLPTITKIDEVLK